MPDLDDVLAGKAAPAEVAEAATSRPISAPAHGALGFLDNARQAAGSMQASLVGSIQQLGGKVAGQTGSDWSVPVLVLLVVAGLGFWLWSATRKGAAKFKKSPTRAAASGGGVHSFFKRG